jgi:hypothetical protein
VFLKDNRKGNGISFTINRESLIQSSSASDNEFRERVEEEDTAKLVK